MRLERFDCVHACLLISWSSKQVTHWRTALIQITSLANYECGAGAWTYLSQHSAATSRKKRRLHPATAPFVKWRTPLCLVDCGADWLGWAAARGAGLWAAGYRIAGPRSARPNRRQRRRGCSIVISTPWRWLHERSDDIHLSINRHALFRAPRACSVQHWLPGSLEAPNDHLSGSKPWLILQPFGRPRHVVYVEGAYGLREPARLF